MKLESPKSREALRWIVGLLKKHEISYQITGGLAAKAYGVNRPLGDMDFDILNSAFAILLPEVKRYVIEGPLRLQDETWDLMLMTLDYHGQLIDFSGADDGRVFDKTTQQWRDCPANLKTAILTEIEGAKVPVINKADLIAYKSILRRDVDLLDLAGLQNIPT